MDGPVHHRYLARGCGSRGASLYCDREAETLTLINVIMNFRDALYSHPGQSLDIPDCRPRSRSWGT